MAELPGQPLGRPASSVTPTDILTQGLVTQMIMSRAATGVLGRARLGASLSEPGLTQSLQCVTHTVLASMIFKKIPAAGTDSALG